MEEVKKEENNSNDQFDAKTKKTVIILILITVISIVSVFFIDSYINNKGVFYKKETGNKNTIFYRQANNGDVSVEFVENISTLTIDCIIKPNSDINNFEFVVKIFDSKSNLIKTVNKSVGNVKAGIQFTIPISLSFSEIFKCDKISLSVTGGSVLRLS